ncbi:MAG: DEAD/DEAH box helicase [Syntrophales bacterium]|nr:DEAD/DEAH box helicase [Syntrophales bacterium]
MSRKILIVAITPYFLEKRLFWFKENFQKIIEARKTQSFFEDNTVILEKDQKFPLMDLLRKIDELGYEKVQSIEKPGEFSHLGNMVNIFPINIKNAIRLEYSGNRIEGIEDLNIKIENEDDFQKTLKKKISLQREMSGIKNIKPGDFVVHLDHGIGIFKKIEMLNNRQFYVLEYASGDKLFIPLGLERKLSHYVGFTAPTIHRLGSQVWQKIKRRVREEAEKFAKELLDIYAKREIILRPPYPKDEEIQNEVEFSFQYLETPDQKKAIEDIKKDMESSRPMDRIICGDVGFGKTEVALRAIVKCVISGGQALLLSPTTVLCNQHFKNFKSRLEKLPIKVASLSRLEKKSKQKKTIGEIKNGTVDIIIATHRALSSDVEFKNLKMAVIDEEQRFGVKQKEKIKKLRSTIDILSLSATPIPRTMYLGLTNLRDISLILTPPSHRIPIKTFILPLREQTIKKAIEEELGRKGQVYYLHNRVETIEKARAWIKKISPKSRVEIAHGKISEQKILKVMTDLEEKKIDVLVATTIIENGLDFPNINTLIVADSTRLGLSQAYQIRGRIGRGNVSASAYFLYPSRLRKKARERLRALQEAEELGSGYQVSLKDLELRGAGNILGKEQSGHVNSVGLNLYCQMISEEIEKNKLIS